MRPSNLREFARASTDPIRLAAFNWLADQVRIHGDVLPRTLLQEGFVWNGTRVPLVSPQGIFKPQIMNLPLSITTVSKGPYDDSFDDSGFLKYRYRGTNPNHRDNVGLRETMQLRLPLVYFHSILPSRYLVIMPVYIIEDDPKRLTFTVAVDETDGTINPKIADSEHSEDQARKAYATASVRIRLHQRSFREKVLAAYKDQCSFCRLRHRELLDAAHILPDSDQDSTALVSNGLALCKLHHAAFDRFIIGITPDFEIHVRADILVEEDGPMLQHGIKGLHGERLILPSSKVNWPKRDFLDRRYQEFRGVA